MKPSRWALVALLLLALPNAAAEPDPARQRETVAQTGGGLHVVEQLDWEFATNASYDGVARFQAPAALSNLSVTLWQGSLQRPLPPSAVQKAGTTAAGLDLYRVDLKALQASLPADGRYTVVAEYDTSGPSVRLATTYAVSALTVFVRPLDGYGVDSDYFTDWVPAGYDTHHSARANVPANETYTLSFVPQTVAPSSDRTPMLWGAGGLLAGLVLMLIAVRLGWVASRPRGAKFEKGGTMESRTMLEARRRTLLAALKELEQAHEAKEVPDDAYAPLKEEYKSQAVRVMRNLEEKKEG
jgi:hypothetical protein